MNSFDSLFDNIQKFNIDCGVKFLLFYLSKPWDLHLYETCYLFSYVIFSSWCCGRAREVSEAGHLRWYKLFSTVQYKALYLT